MTTQPPTTQQTTADRSLTAADRVLTDADLAALRQALDRCRDERTDQLAALTRDQGTATDPVSRAHAVAVRETLRAIDAALARVEAGDYGSCRHCARPIPVERLRLVPYAEECVGCRQLRLQGR
jgi:RNA polymerase-binding transcription factor DksA